MADGGVADKAEVGRRGNLVKPLLAVLRTGVLSAHPILQARTARSSREARGRARLLLLTDLDFGVVWGDSVAGEAKGHRQGLVHVNPRAPKLGHDARGRVESSGPGTDDGQAERVMLQTRGRLCGQTSPQRPR